jgi:hypothetical protein
MTSPLAQAIAFQNAVNPTQSGIAPTDVVGAYKLASDVAEKNYQAQLAKQQALWGGLAGIGSAGILGFGKPLAEKWLGTAAPTTAGTASPAASAAVAPTASGTTMAWPGATGVADAGTATGSAALPSFGVDALGAGGPGSVAADMGLGASAPAAGSVATDLAMAAPAAAGVGDAAVAGLPDWLASFLPFLAAA